VGGRPDGVVGVPALTGCLAQAKEIPAASAQWAEEFGEKQDAQRVRPRPPPPSEAGARVVVISAVTRLSVRAVPRLARTPEGFAGHPP